MVVQVSDVAGEGEVEEHWHAVHVDLSLPLALLLTIQLGETTTEVHWPGGDIANADGDGDADDDADNDNDAATDTATDADADADTNADAVLDV